MFCPKCGKKLNEGTQKCTNCGWENMDTESTPMRAQQMNVSTGSAYTGVGVKQFKPSGLSTKKKIFIAAAAVIIMLVIIITSVTNSESYRLNKAEKYMLKGDTSAALNKLVNIYTPQAGVMRSYATVIDAKTVFAAYCDSKPNFGVSAESSSNDEAAINGFLDAVDDFYEQNESAIYLLPTELREQAEYYKTVCQSVKDAGHQNTLFSDLLMVYRNEFKRNEVHFGSALHTVGSDYFTLNELRNNVEKTNTAYASWSVSLSPIEILDVSKNDNTNIDFAQDVFSDFMADCDSLANACKAEAESETKYIDSATNEWGANDSLHLKNPNHNYTVSIISALPTATSKNFLDFPSYFTNSLQFNLLRYYLFYTK